jgi:hypothetical protein
MWLLNVSALLFGLGTTAESLPRSIIATQKSQPVSFPPPEY